MTRSIPTSFHTPTDIIEHALRHAREETWHCDLCDEKGEIGEAELELALESHLVNACALISAIYDPDERTAAMRTLSTLDYLVREALQLFTLSHWADREWALSSPPGRTQGPPLNEALTSVANRRTELMTDGGNG